MAEATIFRFKVMKGLHITADLTQPVNEQTGKRPSKTYNEGETFLSTIDLHNPKLFGSMGREKFKRLKDKVTASQPDEPKHDFDEQYGPLDEKTQEELIDIAKNEQLDVDAEMTVEQLIGLIRSSAG
jgi:hypothetical protein